MAIFSRRILGPIATQMGGNISGSTTQGGSGGGGGGGGSVTINNNVAGYILKATGIANTIEGIPEFRYDSGTTTISSSANIYLTGSSYEAGPYLFIQGTDAEGNLTKIKLHVTGGMLKVIDEDIE